MATAAGFGMMIGGSIIGSFPLVVIGSVIGIIGMICVKHQLMMLKEEHYEAASKEFGEKLDKYLNSKGNDIKNEDVCKALDDGTELIKGRNLLGILVAMEYGTNELANRILTTKNIGKNFKCLESKDEKVKSSAASLIRAALIQDQIRKDVKVAIFTSLAKMAKNENNNDNNNNINNNGILEKYLGKDALNSLKALNLPNKKSARTEQDKNGNQSQIEAKLDEIIGSIKSTLKTIKKLRIKNSLIYEIDRKETDYDGC